MTGRGKARSVSQMLSQNHTANHINFWLTDWKNRNVRVDEVIIDSSEALWNACVKSFAECNDTNSYITLCTNSLLFGTKPPASFIRSDRSHFVKAVINNNILKRTPEKMKSILLGVIGYVIQCERIEECEIILRHIFTLTKNEYVNDDVMASKDFLKELVSTHDFTSSQTPSPPSSLNNDWQIDIFHEDKTRKYPTTYKDTSMFHWIMNIYESVHANNQGGKGFIDSAYFSSTAEDFVFRIFVRLPLWSNIMCGVFDSDNYTPSSTPSENEFKNIKRLMGIKTYRVNVFVNLHLEQIFGISKLALANQKSADAASPNGKNDIKASKTTRRKRSSSASEANNSSNSMLLSSDRSRSENDIIDTIQKEAVENWKGRNQSPTLLRRSRVSILNPHNIDYSYKDIPLLRNGYTSKARKTGQKSIVVSNTCAMDSVIAIYCAAYLDNKVAKNEVNDATPENTFSFFIKTFFTDKKPKFHYENRTKLLMKIFTKENYINQIVEDEHSITVSCKSGIAGFFEKLVKEDSGRIASHKKTRCCTECNYVDVNYSAMMPLHISMNSDVNLVDIERYISLDNSIAFKCRGCGKNSIVSHEFKNIIAFEVEPLVHKRMKKYTTSQLKDKICVDGEIYNLFGLIENIPVIQHFVAHVKRNNGIWQSIDDLKNEIGTSKRINATPMYIFMLFYIKQEK